MNWVNLLTFQLGAQIPLSAPATHTIVGVTFPLIETIGVRPIFTWFFNVKIFVCIRFSDMVVTCEIFADSDVTPSC